MKSPRLLHYMLVCVSLLACATIPSDGLDADTPSEVDQLRPLLRVPVQVTVGNDANFAPDISLDGRYLVHTTSINGNKEVALKDRKKKIHRLLTNHAADDFAPAISPDHKRVAFLTRRLDAAGDVAFADVDRSFFSNSLETNLQVASKPESEELAPTWFPDGESVLVPVRDDPRQEPKLMRLFVKNLTWQDIGGIRGEYPHTSSDGKQLLYVRGGKIYLFDLAAKSEQELTAMGRGTWARPRFITGQKNIVAVRYADDTNRDGVIDGSDHGTIWKIALGLNAAGTRQAEQLTSAGLNSFLPELRSDGLYVTLEAKGSLEIFKLPASGQARKEWLTLPEDLWLWSLKNPYDRYFALDSMSRSAEAVGKRSRAIELALRSLEERLEHATEIEMNYALDDALREHDQDSDLKQLVAAFRLLTKNLADLSALDRGNANTAARKRIVSAIKDIEDLEQEARKTSQGNASHEVSSYLNVKKAELLFQLGDLKAANLRLARISKKASPRTVALGTLVTANITGASKNDEGKELLLLAVAKEAAAPIDIRRRAATLYVRSLVDRKIDSEGFERARQDTKGVPFVPTLLHVEIAQNFIRSGKPAVGVNEYRQILVDHCRDDAQFMPEIAEEYVAMALTHGGIEVADQSLDQAAACVASNRLATIEMKQVRAKALIAYGQRLMREREFGNALKLFRLATESDPVNLAGWRGLIDATYRRKTLPEQKKIFDVALAKKPFDLVANYNRGYLETYAVDEAKTPSNKIAAVDRSIEQISRAVEIDATQIFPHQTLGWLHMQRAQWTDRMRNGGGLRGKASSILSKVKNFVGRPEDNDVELAIDSFQAALFLSEEHSQERANIIQNLAEAYYQLDNHQKALTYYVERLKLSKEFPFSDRGSEASVLRLAGRSAFQIDELDLAEQLQRRALVVWKDEGNDPQISYSMDALALTLREEKKYDEAIALYQDIYERHHAAQRSMQAQLALSNKAYCLYMSGRNEDALKAFLDSDYLPVESDKNAQDGKTSDAIAVDVGGEASAAKGFDDTARRNMNLTFEARILEALSRNAEAVQKYRDKIALLDGAMKDANPGKKKALIEEKVITRNNLGWTLVQSGQLDAAAAAFRQAMLDAKDLRLPGQAVCRDEAVNASAWARTQFRLVVDRKEPQASLQNVIAELKAIENAVTPKDPKAVVPIDAKQMIMQVTVVRAAMEAAASANGIEQEKILQTTLIKTAEAVTDEKDQVKGRELALLGLGAKIRTPNGALADQMRSIRRQAFTTSGGDLAWRAPVAAFADQDLKLLKIEAALDAGSVLATIHDQVAVQDEFIQAFDAAKTDKDKGETLRRFFRARALSAVNRLLQVGSFNTPEAQSTRRDVLKGYLSTKSDEQLKKALAATDRVLLIVDDDGRFLSMVFDPASGWHLATSESGLGSNESFVGGGRKIYVSCVGARCKDFHTSIVSSDNRVAVIATPEMIPRLSELRRLPTSSVVVVSDKNPKNEEIFRAALATHDVRVTQSTNWSELAPVVAEAQIAVFAVPLTMSSRKTFMGEFSVKESDAAPNTGLPTQEKAKVVPTQAIGIPLATIIGKNPWFATGVILPQVTLTQKKDDEIDASQLLSLWLLERDVPSALVTFTTQDTPVRSPSDAKTRIDPVTRFAQETSEALSNNTLQPRTGAIMIGDPGLFDDEAKVFAEKRLGPTKEKALDAKDDGDVGSAKRLFMEAAHYAKILGRDDEALSLYESLIKLLFLTQEYQAALRFEEQKIELLQRKKSTPRTIAATEMEAGVLAIRGLLIGSARAHIAKAETYYVSEEEDLDLAKVHHYYGLIYEAEASYEETIKEYDKSRAFYLKAGDKSQAAQKLLDIGNIYKERLGNFPQALEYYDKALNEMYALKLNDRMPKVQIDRANSLMAMGETRWAINVMENRVLNVITPGQDPALWVRAAQITANAYYQAGLFGDAQKFVAKILEHTGDIKDVPSRITAEIDAKNLNAMILEKLGNHSEAVKIFDAILADARKSKLRGKEAMILNNVGYWNREAGQIQTSIAQFKEALAIDEAAKSEADQAYDLRNLGLSLTLLGDMTQAKATVERALAMSTKMKLAYNEAYSMFALAEISERQLKHDDAIQYFEKARKGAEKAFLQDFVWRAYAATGFVKFKKGDYAGAVTDLSSSIEIIEKLRAGLASESSKTGFASDRGVQDVYGEMVLALMKQKRVVDAWQYSERGRARAFIDAMGGRTLNFGDKALEDSLEAERKMRSDVELDERRLALLPPGSPDEGKVRESVKNHKDVYAKLLQSIETKWPKVMPFLGVRPISPDYVSKKIGGSKALLEYMVLPEETAFWVIEDGAIRGGLIPTGRARIRALIDQYREFMQNFAAVAIPGKELADILLVEPLKLLERAQELVIVPHSELHYLPFAALPVKNGYLLDRFPVSYLESAEMLRFATEPVRSINQKSQVVAFGNPDRGEDLNLPFAEREVKALARSFPHIKSLMGKEATIGAFKENLKSMDVFHFAGHGEFSSVDPSASRLLFAEKDGEGDLTVKAILAMNIPATLVTLSACETGLGKLTSGDDMIGFNRAFFFAGTESLITSLWRISDVASSVTIKRFYHNMSTGVTRAVALREAQLTVKKYYPHPAYWSAFKLSGASE